MSDRMPLALSHFIGTHNELREDGRVVVDDPVVGSVRRVEVVENRFSNRPLVQHERVLRLLRLLREHQVREHQHLRLNEWREEIWWHIFSKIGKKTCSGQDLLGARGFLTRSGTATTLIGQVEALLRSCSVFGFMNSQWRGSDN